MLFNMQGNKAEVTHAKVSLVPRPSLFVFFFLVCVQYNTRAVKNEVLPLLHIMLNANRRTKTSGDLTRLV